MLLLKVDAPETLPAIPPTFEVANAAETVSANVTLLLVMLAPAASAAIPPTNEPAPVADNAAESVTLALSMVVPLNRPTKPEAYFVPVIAPVP
ncbi:MAG: hypothetical protein BWY02_02053 [bacterium ADurb.Bin157]|nr:MAG: hypothetical protein BWY02_02053 [bacterium ADurb.Bin157]